MVNSYVYLAIIIGVLLILACIVFVLIRWRNRLREGKTKEDAGTPPEFLMMTPVPTHSYRPQVIVTQASPST